eukprot:15080819-Alexandrium_andersonii.AAC.1
MNFEAVPGPAQFKLRTLETTRHVLQVQAPSARCWESTLANMLLGLLRRPSQSMLLDRLEPRHALAHKSCHP